MQIMCVKHIAGCSASVDIKSQAIVTQSAGQPHRGKETAFLLGAGVVSLLSASFLGD